MGQRPTVRQCAGRERCSRPFLYAKALQAIVTAGFPDYSEVFNFGWSGKYRIRVRFLLKDAVQPLEARFVHRHAI